MNSVSGNAVNLVSGIAGIDSVSVNAVNSVSGIAGIARKCVSVSGIDSDSAPVSASDECESVQV